MGKRRLSKRKGPPDLAAELAAGIDRALKQPARFVPDCDPAEYRTNVYHRVLVRDCDDISDEEKREMSEGLIRAGQRSAGAICELNRHCPNPRLLRYEFVRIECENRLWEVDLRWFFKCVP